MRRLFERSDYGFLYDYLFMHRARLLLLFLFIVSGVVLQMFGPRFIGRFIDDARNGVGTDALVVTALFFLGVTVLKQGVMITVQYLTSDMSWKLTNRLRFDLTNRCLNYDLSFHNRYPAGEMVDRIDGDVGRLHQFMSGFILKVLSNSLLCLCIMVVIFLIHPVMGIVVALASIIALFVLFRVSRYGSNTIRHYNTQNAELLGYLDERIAGREDIKALHAEADVLRTYDAKLRELYRTRKRTGTQIGTVINTGEIVISLVLAITILTMGIIYLRSAALSTGTLFLIYYYITILLVPLKNMVSEVTDLQHVRAACSRIRELLAYENKVGSHEHGGHRITEPTVSVTFEQVTFGYEKAMPVLQNISFHVPARKTVGIVGKSGSGKTTLVRLLFRLCDPQSGEISLQGIPLRQIEWSSLRQSIGLISQNIELFEGTLRDNITMYKEKISDEEIMKIVESLSLGEWLEGMSSGLNTRIERDGRNISAGQAQLIALARTFLQNPRMVIMDEVTSRMDPSTEKWVERALAALLHGRTTLIIAHRLSTIRHTDYTLVMNEGSVEEFGETNVLLQNPRSAYSRWIREGGHVHA